MPTSGHEAQRLVEETQKAREALEAKGAFTEANATTHVILALEALTKLLGYDEAERQRVLFQQHYRAH